MARTTVKELEAKMVEQSETIDKLYALVEELAAQDASTDKPKGNGKGNGTTEKPWWGTFPEYGTPAQRVEWEKLVKKAKATRSDIEKAAGTKGIKCFIPVPNKDKTRMPHTIKWSVSYN